MSIGATTAHGDAEADGTLGGAPKAHASISV